VLVDFWLFHPTTKRKDGKDPSPGRLCSLFLLNYLLLVGLALRSSSLAILFREEPIMAIPLDIVSGLREFIWLISEHANDNFMLDMRFLPTVYGRHK
jgi:hypothetical protein